MSTEHKISVRKTARFFSFGCVASDAKQIWIVCHGYGHLAEYFIKHFEVLANKSTMVVAPEGLNRFYLTGASGRVGASWMTREARLDDIEDYITFLDHVYNAVAIHKEVNVHVIGFSQGAATVCRWITASKQRIESLTLWAGMFPPDLDLKENIETLKKVKQLFLVMGKEDEYLTLEEFKEQEQACVNVGLKVTPLIFDGKHEIKTQILQKLKGRIS